MSLMRSIIDMPAHRGRRSVKVAHRKDKFGVSLTTIDTTAITSRLCDAYKGREGKQRGDKAKNRNLGDSRNSGGMASHGQRQQRVGKSSALHLRADDVVAGQS